MVKKQWYAVFYGDFENEQKKDKIFLTFWSGDSNPRFSVILTRSNQNKLLKEIGTSVKIAIFLTLLTHPFWWRNVGMVPRSVERSAQL